MKVSILNLINKIKNLKSYKHTVLPVIDIILIYVSFFLSYLLIGVGESALISELLFVAVIPFIAIPVFSYFSLYRVVYIYIDISLLWRIVKAVSLFSLFSTAGLLLLGLANKYKIILIDWVFLVLLISFSRFFIQSLFLALNKDNKKNMIIYGAGFAGVQLYNSLMSSKVYNPVLFIDENTNLHGKYISNLKIYNASNISGLIKKFNVEEIVVAIPSASQKKLRRIYNSLEKLSIIIKSTPSMDDIVKNNFPVKELHRINVNDLLERGEIKPNFDLLSKDIANKIVMVTGAGGSIGSELCRQIVKLKAKKIVLFEHNEFSIYNINEELRLLSKSTDVVPILGSVTNQAKVEKVCKEFNIQTIYHAAAYKHVPMVELNMGEGIFNNVFGTLYVVQAAINSSVEKFILISTDKAVRPTNIMGTTKRLSEIILLSLGRGAQHTKFSIVRFGNVLGSSGSVIPLFEKQIDSGGPVTVTDREVTRYFMTIQEAVELVIQAGALTKGISVYALDMGKQIKIYNVAKKMIHLKGFNVKNESSQDEGIEIKIVGLRPGEKLYEELLIDGEFLSTKHKKIMQLKEGALEWNELNATLNDLKFILDNSNDCIKLREVLTAAVPEYAPQCDIVDLIHCK